jgi:site-specific recombinase XerD
MDRQESIARFEQSLKRRFPDRRTPIDYVSDIRQFAAQCSKPWREVTLLDIDAFVDQQRAEHSQATVQRRVAALKSFFDFLAEDSGELSWPNPVRFKRHGGKLPQRLPRDLSDETVERVWQAISAPRDRAWFVLMWRAGLRVGEVVDLKLTDLLSPAGTDHPARLRVLGKGRKERIVLLTAEAEGVVQAWLAVRPASNQPYIFLNERGQPLKPNGVLWLLHRYGQQVEVELTPHQLRHTFARQTVEAGLPLASLGKLLGHAQLETTQRYTAGADPALYQVYQATMTRLTAGPGAAPEPPAPPVSPSPPPTPATAVAPTPLPPAALRPLVPPPLPEWETWASHLPQPLRQVGLAYVQRRLPHWSPLRQRIQALKYLGDFQRFWDWQLARRPLTQPADLHLADLQAYQSQRVAHEGVTATTVNRVLNYVLTALREQADAGVPVDAAIFRLRPLPEPHRLPRFLPDSECRRLEAFVLARLDSPDPLICLENACFLVLAHTGLRASECVYLEVGDLDLPGRRLVVRQGKGRKDRVVYLSDLAAQALTRYLGPIPRPAHAPLWIRPNGRPLRYEWLANQMAALGLAAGVAEITPHRLRHSLATRLLNAGMDITRIQKLLGHTQLSTTQVYAQVLDVTLEADYRRAMTKIELHSRPLSDQPVAVDHWPLRSDLKSLVSAEIETRPLPGNLSQMAD